MTTEPRERRSLPNALTSFVGRSRELAELTELLQNPACRLLTLVGPGGMGKTRLAIEVAAQQAQRYADGVVFVPLQALAAPLLLTSALADALGYPLTGENSGPAQLLHYLRDKELLLVLDNFEHLLVAGQPEETIQPGPAQVGPEEAVDLLATLVAQTPRVQLLVTSRMVLNLQEEWLYPLNGLEMPLTPPTEPAAALTFGALQLFAERVRHVRRDFDWAAESAHAVRLCQLVEGMPLALELAATWTKTLTCAEIVAEIERNVDFLAVNLRNVPERHRNLRAVFEQSWQQLAADEQAIFARLALFRGGFQRAAAEAITGASLGLLSTLVDKSLVRWEPTAAGNGRYQVHELLRQFAAGKLAAAAAESSVQAAHSRYYLDFLVTQGQALNSAGQRQALDAISQEIDNIRAAWAWAVSQGQVAALSRALPTLYEFYLLRNRYQEGATLFADSARQIQAGAPVQPASEVVSQQLLARQAALLVLMGDYTAASQLLQPLTRTADQRERAFVLRQLGRIAWYQMDKRATEAYYRESLAISRALDDHPGAILTSLSLADQLTNLGQLAEAQALAEQTVARCRTIGRPDWLADALHALAWSLSCSGAYDQAEAHWRESLAIYEQVGDRFGAALAINYLGWVAWCRGGAQLATAQQQHQRALTIYRELGTQGLEAMCLGDLALVALDRGDYAAARQAAAAGLALTEASQSFDLMVYHLYTLGAAESGLGNFAAARRHLCRALQMAWEFQHLPHVANTIYFVVNLLRQELQLLDTASADRNQKRRQAAAWLNQLLQYPAAWQAIKDRAAQQLGEFDERFAFAAIATVRAGEGSLELTSTVAEVSAYLAQAPALTAVPVATHRSPRPQQPLIEPLTERELEILQLIAEGHTNHAIADKLILSPGTVKWYSSEIYGKLSVASRTQAVAEARRLKLLGDS